jgi:hypothetical protein
MDRLYEIGFRVAGRWYLEDGQLRLDLSHMIEQQNVLYAFVTGDSVRYVGKTTQPLQRRMLGYLRPGETQSTNIRNHHAITNSLNRGGSIEILALADTGLLHYGAFHLNLAAGLEDSIIKVLNPEWNGGRISAMIETNEEANPPEASTEAALEAKQISEAPSFKFTLQPTYYERGFFNVPVLNSKLFAGDKAEIEMYCGPEKLVVPAVINRTANLNGTPRIMGGPPLRNWLQKQALQDAITVMVLSPTTIRLSNEH